MAASASLIDEFLRIPLPSGRVLAAHIWRPAQGGPVPAILDLSPYRAFDVFRTLEASLLPWWAERGYAVLAVDTAGAGGSTGLLLDEYETSEIDDAVAVVAWSAAQPWCDGSVGLSGLSWAAFTALRAAGRAPPALKAMVLGGVSEDGWTTDIHNLGGAPYAGLIDWSGVMLMFNALPPDPQQFGAGWRKEWLRRLEANRPFVIRWLSHPERDPYWKDRAARPSDIPLLLYSGWADKYSTSVLRIAATWRGPVRTIIGPWEHAVPVIATHGPRIGFLQEALRWWDRWLKGRDTGVMDEPALRLWVAEPDRAGGLQTGTWRGMAWPMTAARSARFRFGTGPLVLKPAPQTPATLQADLYEDVPGPWPAAGALTTAPATADLEIIAAPVLRCRLRSDRAGGLLVARLLDIAPDGQAVRMTTGALNLAFHDGSGRASPPTADEILDIALPFQATAWRLRAGHRLGLLLSAEGWPTLWPSRTGATLTLDLDTLELGVPDGAFATSRVRPFEPPTTAAVAGPGPAKWLGATAQPLPTTGLSRAAVHAPAAVAYHLAATGTDYRMASRFDVELTADGSNAAAAKVYRAEFERPDWSVSVTTRLEVRSTAARFGIKWSVQATQRGKTVFDHGGEASVARGAA
ncbi:CocE/NonD family hydrolase [Phenylobacterium sp.]|uniref:CocE/NonD family hydrolase n=1 Tax=Phenylobacterium sp. TaxID=1871053 RepID=UPI0025EC644F|nr:CocE/NonD family hydrolase [Phenylobacterium sp.]